MITNQMLLLLVLSTLWPSTAMPFTPGNIGTLFGKEADGRILQRSKRGWMWNQFFLLEEYTGNDHQYVGKVTGPHTCDGEVFAITDSCQGMNWLRRRARARGGIAVVHASL